MIKAKYEDVEYEIYIHDYGMGNGLIITLIDDRFPEGYSGYNRPQVMFLLRDKTIDWDTCLAYIAFFVPNEVKEVAQRYL